MDEPPTLEDILYRTRERFMIYATWTENRYRTVNDLIVSLAGSLRDNTYGDENAAALKEAAWPVLKEDYPELFTVPLRERRTTRNPLYPAE
jgi:hypothetical protein